MQPDNQSRPARERRHGDRRAPGPGTEAFLAMLAHELRNPLAPISMAVAVLDRVPSSEPTVAWVRDVIHRQVNHLSRLLDDLLDVSRVTSGRIELQRESVVMADLIAEAIETSLPGIRRRHQHFTADVGADRLVVSGDPVRLVQALCNLLDNASKYTPDGGVICLTAVREGQTALIRVEDDGDGIPPAVLPRVFDLFMQGDVSLNRKGGGLGVGLTVVKQVVEMHGGTVDATSAGAGQGTAFTIALPLMHESPATPRQAASDVSAPDAKRRIVIVDDNVDANQALAAVLRLHGHEVHSAFDGLDALDLIAEVRPQFVLCDIGLPRMNGYEVAREVSDTDGPRPVMIAITGYGLSRDRERALASGFAMHLVKPVEPTVLLGILRQGSDPT